MRLNTATWVVIGAAVGIVLVFATNQVVPASSAYQAQIRVWLAARATGITAYLLLSILVSFGLILSHPTNQSTWKLSKRLFPWHENLFVFVIAFLVAHIVSLVVDPYAGIGSDTAGQIAGTFIPGLSMYRSAPVALGTLAMYAMLVSGITARWTRLLPQGFWLKLHRFALVAWALAWVHGLLSGTDAVVLVPLYAVTGLAVVAAAAYRYWVAKKGRPTFATSLAGATAARARAVHAGPGVNPGPAVLHAPGSPAPSGARVPLPPRPGASRPAVSSLAALAPVQAEESTR